MPFERPPCCAFRCASAAMLDAHAQRQAAQTAQHARYCPSPPDATCAFLCATLLPISVNASPPELHCHAAFRHIFPPSDACRLLADTSAMIHFLSAFHVFHFHAFLCLPYCADGRPPRSREVEADIVDAPPRLTSLFSLIHHCLQMPFSSFRYRRI